MESYVTRVISLLVFICSCIPESQQSCYSSSCAHNASLSECTRGSYTCQSSEFCEVTSFEHTGSVRFSMECRPLAEKDNCMATELSMSSGCTDPTHPHQEICHWCCDDDPCMKQMASGMAPALPTGNQNACYNCSSNTDLAHCALGTNAYRCQQNEFCEVTSYSHSGTNRYTMECRPSQELTSCRETQLSLSGGCSNPATPHTDICHWCCGGQPCMQSMARGIAPPQGCASSPCQHGGTCFEVMSSNGFTCSCTSAYTGVSCELQTTTARPTTTTTHRLDLGNCPPFDCNLDCGLAGYLVDSHGCMQCKCDF